MNSTIQSPVSSIHTPSFNRPPSSPLLPPTDTHNRDINITNDSTQHMSSIDITNDQSSIHSIKRNHSNNSTVLSQQPIVPLPVNQLTNMTLQQHHSRIVQLESCITDQSTYVTQLQCQVQELQNQLNTVTQQYISLQSSYNTLPQLIEQLIQQQLNITPTPYLQRNQSTDTTYSIQSGMTHNKSHRHNENHNHINHNNIPSLTITKLHHHNKLTPATPTSARSLHSVSPASHRHYSNASSKRSSLNTLSSPNNNNTRNTAAPARTHVSTSNISNSSTHSDHTSQSTIRTLAQRITQKLRVRDESIQQPRVNNLIESTVDEAGESRIDRQSYTDNPLDSLNSLHINNGTVHKRRGHVDAPDEYIVSIRPDIVIQNNNKHTSHQSSTADNTIHNKPNLQLTVDAMAHRSGEERTIMSRMFQLKQREIATGSTHNTNQRSILDIDADRKRGKRKTNKICKVGDCTELRYMDEKYCRVHSKSDMVTNPNARRQLSHRI